MVGSLVVFWVVGLAVDLMVVIFRVVVSSLVVTVDFVVAGVEIFVVELLPSPGPNGQPGRKGFIQQ